MDKTNLIAYRISNTNLYMHLSCVSKQPVPTNRNLIPIYAEQTFPYPIKCLSCDTYIAPIRLSQTYIVDYISKEIELIAPYIRHISYDMNATHTYMNITIATAHDSITVVCKLTDTDKVIIEDYELSPITKNADTHKNTLIRYIEKMNQLNGIVIHNPSIPLYAIYHLIEIISRGYRKLTTLIRI